MKRILIIALLGIAPFASPAQEKMTMDHPKVTYKAPANAKPAYPKDATRPYKVLTQTQAPCYVYKKNNIVVMECPGVLFAPDDQAATAGDETIITIRHTWVITQKQETIRIAQNKQMIP